MKLALIGTGYVGLVGAAVFAEWGNSVTGIDIDDEKIKKIKEGVMPIYEPGLKDLVMKNIKESRLSFTTSIPEGMKDAEIVFICVGTPQGDTGAADLSAVWKVAEEVGKNLDDYKIVVTKSTVPVGTNEKVKQIIKENLKKDIEFDVASNPEFLREGYSVEDMKNPDRTVLGSDSIKAIEKLKEIYTHLNRPIVECDLRSAEMIKYASNAFLATKISFINEMGQLCERAHADVSVVSKGMGLDSRIGPRFLNAGIGYGGSCFPKDVAALYRTSTDQAYDFKLIRSVMEVNRLQQDHFLTKVTRFYGNNLCDKTFGVLGVAFKENTDDVRESVAIDIVRKLRGLGAQLKIFDPKANDNAKVILGNDNITYCSSLEEVCDDSDALFILTEWKEFTNIDLPKVKNLLKDPVIFDGKNMLDKNKVESMNYIYFAIGKHTNGLDQLLDKGYYTQALLTNGEN